MPRSAVDDFAGAGKNALLLYTHVISFTLFELETITKSFRSDYILGEGGFSTVYKGYIDENVRVGLKSLPVAVKVLNFAVFRRTPVLIPTMDSIWEAGGIRKNLRKWLDLTFLDLVVWLFFSLLLISFFNGG